MARQQQSFSNNETSYGKSFSATIISLRDMNSGLLRLGIWNNSFFISLDPVFKAYKGKTRESLEENIQDDKIFNSEGKIFFSFTIYDFFKLKEIMRRIEKEEISAGSISHDTAKIRKDFEIGYDNNGDIYIQLSEYNSEGTVIEKCIDFSFVDDTYIENPGEKESQGAICVRWEILKKFIDNSINHLTSPRTNNMNTSSQSKYKSFNKSQGYTVPNSSPTEKAPLPKRTTAAEVFDDTDDQIF
jgi:hypothetical protein